MHIHAKVEDWTEGGGRAVLEVKTVVLHVQWMYRRHPALGALPAYCRE